MQERWIENVYNLGTVSAAKEACGGLLRTAMWASMTVECSPPVTFVRGCDGVVGFVVLDCHMDVSDLPRTFPNC